MAALPPLAGESAGVARKPGKTKRKSGGGLSPAAIGGIATGILAVIGGGMLAMRSGGEPKPAEVEAAPVAEAAPAEPPPSEFVAMVRPYFQTHCIDCHSSDSPEGDLDLESDLLADDGESRIVGDRTKWEHVYEMIRVGAMPPADMPEPSTDEQDAIVAWLDRSLFHIDCEASPTPGRVIARRLNRTEYNNTVADLFGVSVRPADDFPSDEVGYGFDNIGSVQSAPPLLIEKYLDAAEEVAQAVIATGDPDREVQSRSGDQLRMENGATKQNGVAMLGQNGFRAAWRDVRFPRGGQYVIRLFATGDQVPKEELPKVELRVGDELVRTFEVAATGEDIDTLEHRMSVPQSRKPVTVTFINDLYRPRGKYAGDRNVRLSGIEIEGPFGVSDQKGGGVTSQLLANHPGKDPKPDAVRAIARKNLEPVAWRVFRRPVENAELDELAGFAAATVEMGGSFEEAMQASVQVMLCSPKFLYRVEPDDGSLGRVPRPLDDWELASRLSYFLWNSMPDDELFDKARAGELRKPDVLASQVDRMLRSERSQEMLENFAGQWLGLRQLPEQSVDGKAFPKFDGRLFEDMARETESLVAHLARENRPVAELLTADYTFVNGRLARHYGIPDVEGDEFRRVSLSQIPGEAGRRRGLLTHGSVLALTSYPNRTSPVRRGEWILTNILGDEPPPPPPNVPALDETQASNPDAPLREQLEQHRADPNCAACHRTMDELGFGFESFDAVGRYRQKDGQHDVDASGTLPSGQSFDGPMELVDILEGRKDEFTHTFVERLLTFALGRNVDYRDQCIVNKILVATADGEHRFQDVVREVALSEAFRRQGPDPEIYAAR